MKPFQKLRDLLKQKSPELSPDAQEYVNTIFPCEPPCDSYGVCGNCHEKTCFKAGYNLAIKTNRFDKALEALDLAVESMTFANEHLESMKGYSLIVGARHNLKEALAKIRELGEK